MDSNSGARTSSLDMWALGMQLMTTIFVLRLLVLSFKCLPTSLLSNASSEQPNCPTKTLASRGNRLLVSCPRFLIFKRMTVYNNGVVMYLSISYYVTCQLLNIYDAERTCFNAANIPYRSVLFGTDKKTDR